MKAVEGYIFHCWHILCCVSLLKLIVHLAREREKVMGGQKKMRVERRKDRRYKALEGAFAAINFSSHKLGQIIDISMGGICFKYVDTGIDDKEAGTQESISLSSMGHYVGDLPFRTAGDYEVLNLPTFSFMKVMKKHVQFSDLNLKQLCELDNYLRNNVSEPVEQPPLQYKP